MQLMKKQIKSKFPFLVPFWGQLSNVVLRLKSRESIFTQIYREKLWGGTDSVSGPGSDLKQTQSVRKSLPILLQELDCRSLLDIPCGDFAWMKELDLQVDYVGADIVNDLIIDNQNKFGNSRCHFLKLDITQDQLPDADLLLCRDCFVHFSFADIFLALKNIKESRCTYLLTTTYMGVSSNEDIPTGRWRPINLECAPFSLPAPIRLVKDEDWSGDPWNKCLGLWKTIDIPYYG